MMNDEASAHLLRLLKEKGPELINNPQRCRGLILDNFVGFRAEANALISALNNHIPAALLSAPKSAPRKATVSALARRLQSELNMDAQAARWAVESWATALSATPALLSESSAAETENNHNRAQVEKSEAKTSEPETQQSNLQSDRKGLSHSASEKPSENHDERDRKKPTTALVAILLFLLVGAWYFVQGRANKPNKPLLVLKGTGELVKALSRSLDGQRLASADASGGAAIWDANTGKQLGSLRVDNGSNLISAGWSPDNKRLATGNIDGTVGIWDASSGKQLLAMGGQSLPGNSDFFARTIASASSSRVLRVDWSPDGKRLAAGYKDGRTDIWDPVIGKTLNSLGSAGSSAPEIDSIAWSLDGRWLAAGYADGSVIVWDPADEKQVSTMKVSQNGAVGAIAWSPDGQHLATIDEQRAGEVWDVATGKELLYLNYRADPMAWSLAWSPDGHRLAMGCGDGSVILWDMQQGKLEETVRGLSPDAANAELLVWSPDGKELAAGQAAGEITVWKIASAD